MLLNKEEFQSTWRWWKGHIKSHFWLELGIYALTTDKISHRVIAYLGLPFRSLFFVVSFLPTSFLRHFVFENIERDIPKNLTSTQKFGYWLRIAPQIAFFYSFAVVSAIFVFAVFIFVFMLALVFFQYFFLIKSSVLFSGHNS